MTAIIIPFPNTLGRRRPLVSEAQAVIRIATRRKEEMVKLAEVCTDVRRTFEEVGWVEIPHKPAT
jgi:hypothetical protein